MKMDFAEILPEDVDQAVLVGRIWSDGRPRLVTVRGTELAGLDALAPTMADLLDLEDVAARVREAQGPVLGRLEDLGEKDLRLLAPCDLQAIKAAGVTFADCLLERVIEEGARGDASQAQSVRDELQTVLGDGWRQARPGSVEAEQLKAILQERGLWSQYLEIGIGPYAEIFTKAQPMSAVGCGYDVGVRPDSAWSNPEPEVVLACDAKGAGGRRYLGQRRQLA